jgi:hypothetical protein
MLPPEPSYPDSFYEDPVYTHPPDADLAEADAIDPVSVAQLFREQLIACLEECAAGRRGLFSTSDHLDIPPWPEAEALRQLALALQAIQAQSADEFTTPDPLCEQFLDLCSIHGENDPGEPRLARAFLAEINGKV